VTSLKNNISLHKTYQLLQNSPVVTYTCRAYGDFGATFITDNIQQQLGYLPSQFLNDPLFWLNHIHPDDRERVEVNLGQLYVEGKHTHEYRFRAADGKYHWMRDVLSLERDDHGNPKQITGYWVDITDQVNVDQRLNQRMNSLSAILDNVIDGIITISDHGVIESFNASAERLFGYKACEVIGENINTLMPELYRSEHDQYLKNYRTTGQGKILGIGPREVEAKRKDGSVTPIDLATSEAIIEGKRSFIGIVRDITERKEAAERLTKLATSDFLTGLANRSLFNERLHHAVSLAKRNHSEVAILYIDLDQFKLVNDSLGHAAGDTLLQETAKRLPKCLRESDTVARLGGDEFAVILENINHTTDIIAIAEKIIKKFEASFNINNNEIFSSVSIGISTYPDDASNIDDLLRNADIAMYKAKDSGRNNWMFYSQGMSDSIRKRQELEAPLRRALAKEKFVLFYQPQLDLGSGKIIGAEALIRWNHPEKGLIPPFEFIPILEETGLIGPVGEWVFQTACRQNKQWQEAGLPEIVVAVNLCAHNFKRKEFTSFVTSTLQSIDLDPKYLDIEITEGTIISDTEETLKILHKMKEIGINLSIDDFGTGYSSLSYLKRLPLDTLKIDRSFVDDITSNTDSATIAQSIIALAHSMRMKVTAEGIETKAQLDFLTRCQCDFMQGFYFSKPVPPEEFSRLLAMGEHLEVTTMPSTPTILILDDEINITSALKRLLRPYDYHVLTANSAQDAYDLLASHNVGVVLCDQRMPDISGTEFLGVVRTLYPQTVRIVLSGYTDLRSVTDAINAGAIFKFLTKPWDDAQLLRNIEESFEYYKLTTSAYTEQNNTPS